MSLAHGPKNAIVSAYCILFADVLCVFEWLAAKNKSTENLSMAGDMEARDTPKSKRSAIHSAVDGARRRG